MWDAGSRCLDGAKKSFVRSRLDELYHRRVQVGKRAKDADSKKDDTDNSQCIPSSQHEVGPFLNIGIFTSEAIFPSPPDLKSIRPHFMKKHSLLSLRWFLALLLSSLGWSWAADSEKAPAKQEPKAEASSASQAPVDPTTLPATVEEARMRAKLLYSALHGSLRVIHRDYFRRSQKQKIPTESLRDVFAAMEAEWNVKIRWLATNENAMNVDNQASDEFQFEALKQITSGKKEHEAVEGDRYRFAGTIPLGSECLKCHDADRDNLEEKYSAMEVDILLRPAPKPAAKP